MIRSEYPPTMMRSISAMPSTRMDPTKRQVIADLLQEPGNGKCADCDAPIDMETTWAVLLYGILVCDDCKLVHIERQNQKKPEDGDLNNAASHGKSEFSFTSKTSGCLLKSRIFCHLEKFLPICYNCKHPG